MSTAPVAADLKRGRSQLAAAVVLGHAIKHIYNSGLQQIVLPEIKIGLAINDSRFGTLLTARAVTSGISTMASGFLGDRFSNRASLMLGISLGLMGMSQFLAGYAPNYWTMFLAMLLIGVGPAMYHPPAISALSRRFPDRRGFAISLHGTGGIAGEVMGPLIVGALLAYTFLMWRDVLKMSVLPALLAALLVWAMMRSLPTKEEAGVTSVREYFLSLAGLLSNRMVLILVLSTALRSVGESAVDGFLPKYLREDLDFSPIRVAVYLSTAQVAGLIAQPVMGYVSDRFGRKVVLLPVVIAVGLLALALSVAGPGLSLLLIIVAKGAFKFSLHHIFIAAAIDAARGQAQSTVVSLIYGAGFFGAFSPAIAGVISDRYGTQSAFFYGGCVLLLPAFLLLMLKLPPSRE